MYLKKWSIFNLDGKPIVEGAKFKVEYFSNQGPDRFVYVFQGGEPCIDHSGLTDNPDAQVRFFPTGSPNGALYNKDDLKIEYNGSSRKWCLANINGNPIQSGTAYNILITSGVSRAPVPSPAPTPTPTISTPPAASTSAISQPTSNISATPALLPMARPPTSKSIQLAFDRLNDFAAKGLPASAALPTGDLDLAAVIMARQISRSDENSLPVLLAALQTAGFTVIDENGTTILKPADGNGQGLVFYDFEAVGALKVANMGFGTSLEKIVGIMTKDTPEIPAAQVSTLMMQDLRSQADNSENKFLRFWARLVIELGKSSAKPIDITTAAAADGANLSMLQATLLIRRLQGDLYLLKTRSSQASEFRSPLSLQNSFVSAAWKSEESPFFPTFYKEAVNAEPCNMTKDEAYIMSGASKVLTFGNKKVLGTLFPGADLLTETPATPGSAMYKKISNGLSVANIFLSWAKLVASVTSLRGEITVDNPPVIRTINSSIDAPGNKRLMRVRIWNEVGKLEMLNCVRKYINTFAGLDMAMPIAGPVSKKAVEWHFAGENETRVNDSDTRNTDKFAQFESPPGENRDPKSQVTDSQGISKMYLVGAPKVPALVYQKKPPEIKREANIVVGIRLKSGPDKDPGTNGVDAGGLLLSTATASGPISVISILSTLMVETGYRLPWAVAWATVPVIDHVPCDGQWYGTVTYSAVTNIATHEILPPSKDSYTTRDGGHNNFDETRSLSGTVTVDGRDQTAQQTVDKVVTTDHETHGTTVCCTSAAPCNGRTIGRISWANQSSLTLYGSGNGQGKVSVYIGPQKDGYRISVNPFSVIANMEESSSDSGHLCIGNHPGSFPTKSDSRSFQDSIGSDPIEGTGSYGDDPNTLSGTYSKTFGVITKTITWNLSRCTR